MRAQDAVLVVGATLRLTRLVTTDDLGLWAVREPLLGVVMHRSPPLPPAPEEGEELVAQEFTPSWLQRAYSGLDCPFCVGFWIGAAVLGSYALVGRSKAWRGVAAALTLNYLTGHVAARLDGRED